MMDKQAFQAQFDEYRREVEGADAITAHNADGSAFLTGKADWCVHPGEFEKVVLPGLQAEGKEQLE